MYKIYYTDELDQDRSYKAEKLEEALKIVEGVRCNKRNSFVTMVSENPNSIGKSGVDVIVNGKLPSGEDYTWMKRRKQ